MFKTIALTAEGETLLAQVDELLQGNAPIIADNPVRTVCELLSETKEPRTRSTNREAVEAFLAAAPVVKVQTVRGQEPAADETESTSPVQAEVKTKPRSKARAAGKPTKPVFQQS